jgi:hypothetical protein
MPHIVMTRRDIALVRERQLLAWSITLVLYSTVGWNSVVSVERTKGKIYVLEY